MTSKATLVLLLICAIAACGDAPDSSNGAASATANDRQASSSKSDKVDSGAINIVASGKTVEKNSRGDPNSVQCQLNFTVENRGESEIKSLAVTYDILNRATEEVIKAGSMMIIAVKIGIGETVSPWGSDTHDDFRCTELTLRFPEQPSYQCRTTTEANCASFTYAGSDDVAVEDAARRSSGN